MQCYSGKGILILLLLLSCLKENAHQISASGNPQVDSRSELYPPSLKYESDIEKYYKGP